MTAKNEAKKRPRFKTVYYKKINACIKWPQNETRMEQNSTLTNV